MTRYTEATLVEQPTISFCRQELGWKYIRPEQLAQLRGTLSEVLLRDHLVEALVRINDIPRQTAEVLFGQLLAQEDNEAWLEHLRGNLSVQVPGERGHRPIKLVDFHHPENNRFVVTNQLKVKGIHEQPRVPDVVFFVNGVPLVVLEAKSALGKRSVWDAIGDVAVYEKELPRLFRPNLFNIATNGVELRYGATGSESTFWFQWKDPWPRAAGELDTALKLGLWALLEKRRLLDLLAHFVVFERSAETGGAIKKICRYQQFRATNKVVERVIEGDHKRGLIWHTQGSGKSLTMVFAALKLKFHRGVRAEALQNPNLLVLTDRLDLDAQISRTFTNCGLPNPTRAESIDQFHKLITPGSAGRVVLSTMHKLLGSTRPLEDSASWIILTDEAHRTQEKDLGAYLKSTFPEAFVFGFTGTPVKSNDLDTRRNFCAPGEGYLDKYTIEDAVADGTTVPIRYLSRMTLWDLDDARIDALFDQTFADLPEEHRDQLRARGVTRGDLARFEPRIALIAYDLWVHFKEHLRPDGFKAQIVCVDRRACTVYKRALDEVIAADLRRDGLSEAEARSLAAEASACIYTSAGKEDEKKGNEDLVRYKLDDAEEKKAIERFKTRGEAPYFLIVCDKLLTGFDAPVEQAMYLDKPLVEHNLLQAIARTNRRYRDIKDHGLIVDYVGVTRDLTKALEAYNKQDVARAMEDEEVGVEELHRARAAVFAFFEEVEWTGEAEADVIAAVRALGTEDRWYDFRAAATTFLRAHASVGSNPVRLDFNEEVKLVGAILVYGRGHFEQVMELDFRSFSERIRAMLDEHLTVTGLRTLLTLKDLTDPGFWQDFDEERREGSLETAALRKATELKHILTAKANTRPAQYASLSERIRELIDQLQKQQIDAAQLLRESERLAEKVERLEFARMLSGADQRQFDLLSLLRRGSAGALATSTGDDEALHFHLKSRDRLVELFRSWEHPRCAGRGEPFLLGAAGDDARTAALLSLLERVVNAETPRWVLDQRDDRDDPFAALAERVVGIVDQAVLAPASTHDSLRDRVARYILSVEPFLYKVLAMIDQPACGKIYNKGKKLGLTTVITTLQKEERIPYDLHLSDEEFKSLEGWQDRPSYANALRDVVKVRLDEAHSAKKIDFEVWQSAFAVILGVVEANEAALEAALTPADEGVSDTEREVSPFLADGDDDLLPQLASDIADLYSSDETAPAHWQQQQSLRKELRKEVKRLLLPHKDRFQDKDDRRALINAIDAYATRAFAK